MMKNKITNFSLLTIMILTLLGTTKCNKDDGTSDASTDLTGMFTDARDNTTYNWAKIGNQTWMAENLAYKASTGIWAYDNNESNVAIYGYLYSWETAQTAAPAGWHLPSKTEWQTLIDYLGGSDPAYNKLLETGTNHWGSPNNATNESGFAALPSGYFDQRDNSFNFLGHLTMFHSTTEYTGDATSAMGLILNQNFKTASIEGRPKMLSLPVRCIKN